MADISRKSTSLSVIYLHFFLHFICQLYKRFYFRWIFLFLFRFSRDDDDDEFSDVSKGSNSLNCTSSRRIHQNCVYALGRKTEREKKEIIENVVDNFLTKL